MHYTVRLFSISRVSNLIVEVAQLFSDPDCIFSIISLVSSLSVAIIHVTKLRNFLYVIKGDTVIRNGKPKCAIITYRLEYVLLCSVATACGHSTGMIRV